MLNKKYTKLVAVMGITLFAGAAQAAQLAVNGGFETGDFTGWQQFANTGTQSISTDTPLGGGSFSASLLVNVPVGTTAIKQANRGEGLLALGDVVTVSFDVKGSFFDGGQLNVLSFTEFTGDGATLSNNTTIAGGVDIWTNFSYDVTLNGSDAGGGFSLEFNPVCGGAVTCFSDVLIDNVSITAEVGAVPVPAAVWLFGSGLLGLVGVARRRKS